MNLRLNRWGLVFPIILTSLIVIVGAGPLVASRAQTQAQTAATVRALNALSANGPDCSGSWPTNMAFGMLKNAGVTDNEIVDFSKTKTERIASQKIAKDLFHQVYDVTFTELSGRKIEAIVVSDASEEECSMSDPDMYLVSRHLSAKSRY